jgi:hypothetical protein
MPTDHDGLAQLTMSFGPGVQDAQTTFRHAYYDAWVETYGKDEFSATWDPERGLIAFQDQFYDGGNLPSLPVLERHGDDITIQDYDGIWHVRHPGETFEYGPGAVAW